MGLGCLLKVKEPWGGKCHMRGLATQVCANSHELLHGKVATQRGSEDGNGGLVLR